MKGKNILIFLSGVLATVILTGIAWYSGIPVGLMTSPGANQMEAMGGMEMGGMGMEGMENQSASGEGMAQAAVMVSPARRQLIGVKTEEVKEQSLETIIRTVGTVDYDERRIRQVNLRISGWITDLFVDYTGKFVKKEDPLFTLYSPDLVSTQQEYLLAKKTLERVKASASGGTVTHIRTGAEAQVESARNRLLFWNLTEAQIAQLDQGQQSQRETTIYSPINGVVIKKMALQGMYVTPEMNLYEIADLSMVWVYADIYEYELPMLKVGQSATVTLASYPGEMLRGKVIYIYPYLNKETRTVKVRTEFANPQGKLKPGMYGNVEIRVKPGKHLAIPQNALLDSGTRKLVFVDLGGGMYEPREVTVGNKTNHLYPVLAGLKRGEKVVTSGTFLIDSESKLMAATSMMGMLGMGGIKMEQAQMGEMEMGGMQMGDMKDVEGMKEMKMNQSSSPREQMVGGLTLILATDPEPPNKGENHIRLMVHDQGSPVTDAAVTFAYTMAMPGMEIEIVEAKHTEDGIYEAEVDFGMRGAWELEATVIRGSGKPLKAKFTLSVVK
jgi:membrane fusion protein, copper/silver efflux system